MLLFETIYENYLSIFCFKYFKETASSFLYYMLSVFYFWRSLTYRDERKECKMLWFFLRKVSWITRRTWKPLKNRSFKNFQESSLIILQWVFHKFFQKFYQLVPFHRIEIECIWILNIDWIYVLLSRKYSSLRVSMKMRIRLLKIEEKTELKIQKLMKLIKIIFRSKNF